MGKRRGGPLPTAIRHLAEAIAAMIDPRTEYLDGRARHRGSVYQELREAVYGHHASTCPTRSSSPASPAWLDGIDLASTIDSAVAAWEPNDDGKSGEWSTVNRLRRIATRSWRPQDVDVVNEYTANLVVWVKRYTTLTEPKPKHLPAPCPRCGVATVYRRQDGENVRGPALKLTVSGCECVGCGAYWPSDKFVFLSRLLGYLPTELEGAGS